MDPKIRRDIWNLILRMKGNRLIIMTTHVSGVVAMTTHVSGVVAMTTHVSEGDHHGNTHATVCLFCAVNGGG